MNETFRIGGGRDNDRDRADMAFRQLMAGNVDLVADQVRDAYAEAEDIEEVAVRLRRAEASVRMLAAFAEAAAVEVDR